MAVVRSQMQLVFFVDDEDVGDAVKRNEDLDVLWN
jgi:hypothetical protein